jgi:hypothetical protein
MWRTGCIQQDHPTVTLPIKYYTNITLNCLCSSSRVKHMELNPGLFYAGFIQQLTAGVFSAATGSSTNTTPESVPCFPMLLSIFV